MGGDEPARTLIAAALAGGKAVVTANKHVIAHHGPELRRSPGGRGALHSRAAVAGGVPVLRPLGVRLAADRVTGQGIVNRTTNYPSAMADEGRVRGGLATAQAAGYAEADPSGRRRTTP